MEGAALRGLDGKDRPRYLGTISLPCISQSPAMCAHVLPQRRGKEHLDVTVKMYLPYRCG